MSHFTSRQLEARLGINLNPMQRQCLPLIQTSQNLLVCAPTSSGKSVLFQIAILCQSQPKRLVYLAPVKCLVQQKCRQWSRQFPELKVAQLTSDQDLTSLDYNIILATPQKWRAKGDNRPIMLDQLQLVNIEGRGDNLQAIITRAIIKGVRVMAVSATVPNIVDIGQWLRIKKGFMKVFGQEHRPVALQKHVLGFKGANNPFVFQKTLNYKLLQVIRKYSQGKSSLVFCQTQKGTQKACQQIISDARPTQFLQDSSSHRLLQASSGIQNLELKQIVLHGIGFHHAGLNHNDRKIIQTLYSSRLIKVLCTTSTLAQGVNLPARLVVIKSTLCYRGTGQGYGQYSRIEMQQMMGRAGRTGLDKQGVVVIMTYKQNVSRYQGQEGRLQNLESHLKGKLHQTLNTQIAIRQITNQEEWLSYVNSSFLRVRMNKVPQLYGFVNKQKRTQVTQQLESYAKQVLQDLKFKDLVKTIDGSLVSLQLGTLISKKNISFKTFSLIHEEHLRIQSLEEALRLLSRCQEFQKIRSKIQQRKILSDVNHSNRFKIGGSVNSFDRKVFVILCGLWRQVRYDLWQITRQVQEIKSISLRILSVWLKFCILKKSGKCFKAFHKINKFIQKQTDDHSPKIYQQLKFNDMQFYSIFNSKKVGLRRLMQNPWEVAKQVGISITALKRCCQTLQEGVRTKVWFQNRKDIYLIVQKSQSCNVILTIQQGGQADSILFLRPGSTRQEFAFKQIRFPINICLLFQDFIALDYQFKFLSSDNRILLNQDRAVQDENLIPLPMPVSVTDRRKTRLFEVKSKRSKARVKDEDKPEQYSRSKPKHIEYQKNVSKVKVKLIDYPSSIPLKKLSVVQSYQKLLDSPQERISKDQTLESNAAKHYELMRISNQYMRFLNQQDL